MGKTPPIGQVKGHVGKPNRKMKKTLDTISVSASSSCHLKILKAMACKLHFQGTKMSHVTQRKSCAKEFCEHDQRWNESAFLVPRILI